MRKLITILLLIIVSLKSYSQVDLKGFRLGEKLNTTNFTDEGDGYFSQPNTLGGVKGNIYIGTLNDKTIHSVFFKTRSATDEEVDRMLLGIFKKFNLSLAIDSVKNNNLEIKAPKRQLFFEFETRYRSRLGSPSILGFRVGNMRLVDIYFQEQKEKIDSDF